MRVVTADVKLTYDDFLLFPEDGKRHELIDGEHIVSPCPNTKHQETLGNIYWLVRSWLEGHSAGRVFLAPFDVVLSMFDIVEPDLMYLSHERAAAVLTSKHLVGAPELVVEISSPSTRRRDDTTKRRLYERHDVVEYWVVDPASDIVRVYHRSGTRFGKPVELSKKDGDVLSTRLLPGLELPLAKVFPA